MKILLSSNPYRDRGLRAALEARRGLEHAGVFKADEAGRAAFRRFVKRL